jgi:large subunit ribosomal protein L30
MIGEAPKNRRTAQALGLRKTGRSVYQEDTPSVRGMIHQIKDFVKVETVEVAEKAPDSREQEVPREAAPTKTAKKKPAKETTPS